MNFSCRDCKGKTAECHAHCKTYAKEKAQFEAEKAERRKANILKDYIRDSVLRVKDKEAKHRKNHALKAGCIK